MGEMTREELSAMTDWELLAYEREHHGDPYMTLAEAKEMQRVALQFWHLGAAQKNADREVQDEGQKAPPWVGVQIDGHESVTVDEDFVRITAG
jgi:hypothetical protein